MNKPVTSYNHNKKSEVVLNLYEKPEMGNKLNKPEQHNTYVNAQEAV
jgi:hypothetical protein